LLGVEKLENAGGQWPQRFFFGAILGATTGSFVMRGQQREGSVER
jgi:hypothetical protein